MSLHQSSEASQLQYFDSADCGGGKFIHSAIDYHSLIQLLWLFTSNTANVVTSANEESEDYTSLLTVLYRNYTVIFI
jgi:hypothetical protein